MVMCFGKNRLRIITAFATAMVDYCQQPRLYDGYFSFVAGVNVPLYSIIGVPSLLVLP